MDPMIYTDASHIDAGAVLDYELDLAFGEDEQDFELICRERIPAGAWVYIDGTEYGGVVDSTGGSTSDERTVYKGRTWHGMLAGKVLRPNTGQDHLVVSGDLNAVIAAMVSRVGLGSVFTARTASSGISVSNYRFERYCDAYSGLRGLCRDTNAKLMMRRTAGTVEVWAEPVRTISDEADSDLLGFDWELSHRRVNHLVCLGKGELKDRIVLDLYADGAGNVSSTRTYSGADEIVAVYDYSNADADQLLEDGTKRLREMQSQGTVEVDVTGTGSWDVGDVLSARDNAHGVTVEAEVTKKVVNVSKGLLKVGYAVGERKRSDLTAMAEGGSEGTVYTAGNGISISIDDEISVIPISTGWIQNLD